jgi:hypothetical protein
VGADRSRAESSERGEMARARPITIRKSKHDSESPSIVEAGKPTKHVHPRLAGHCLGQRHINHQALRKLHQARVVAFNKQLERGLVPAKQPADELGVFQSRRVN